MRLQLKTLTAAMSLVALLVGTMGSVADGYRRAAWDKFVIQPDDPDPFEISVDLERIE